MNVFVCIKQVPATETKIKISDSGAAIDSTGIKWIISPYDEFAIEEALRLKEKKGQGSVTVFTVGPQRCVEALRTALAMGCDNAVWVDAEDHLDSFMTAKALTAAVQKEGQPNIIYTGKQAIDDDAAQVSQLLASFLNIPYSTVVVSAEYGDASVKVKREIEGGSVEVLELPFPCLLGAQKGLNEPRFASLPNIMKAKKKEIKTHKLADLGVSESDRKIKIKGLQLPPGKPPGRKIEGDAKTQVKELVRILHEEAKVI